MRPEAFGGKAYKFYNCADCGEEQKADDAVMLLSRALTGAKNKPKKQLCNDCAAAKKDEMKEKRKVVQKVLEIEEYFTLNDIRVVTAPAYSPHEEDKVVVKYEAMKVSFAFEERNYEFVVYGV